MTLGKKAKALGLAGVFLVTSAVAALAAPGTATTTVNVRSGPGPGYGVVDVLRRGDRVDIQDCRGSWCFVSKPGPDGWVSSQYLARGGGGGYWDDDDDYYEPPRRPRPPVYRPGPRPPYYGPGYGYPGYGYPGYGRPGGSVCFNGPNGYFCAGN